jgi:hypothetical protein
MDSNWRSLWVITICPAYQPPGVWPFAGHIWWINLNFKLQLIDNVIFNIVPLIVEAQKTNRNGLAQFILTVFQLLLIN